MFFSPNPLDCDSIKGYIPSGRPHRRRVKYGLDYFWDHFFGPFFGQENVPKNSPTIFYPMSRVHFFLRFNMADNNDSLDVKSEPSQLIERGEQGYTFSLQFDVGVSFHWTVEVPFET